jgi:YidC/Oxa1 family membrane protein insertase
MDRNTIIGFILIGIVLMVWLWMTAPPPQTQVLDKDTVANFNQQKIKESLVSNKSGASESAQQTRSVEDTLGKYFSHITKKENKKIIIETDQYQIELSSTGGTITSWILKNYLTWDRHPVDLLTQNTTGDFHLLFSTSDGKIINTKYLQFDANNSRRFTSD